MLFERQDEETMRAAANGFYGQVRRRRSVRAFSSEAVPEGVVEDCLRAAGTAPSGANLQPWHFAVIKSGAVKKRIREAAEQEEREFYGGRATAEWLDVLGHLGTAAHKPFLEEAPVLIAIFQKSKTTDHRGVEACLPGTQRSEGMVLEAAEVVAAGAGRRRSS